MDGQKQQQQQQQQQHLQSPTSHQAPSPTPVVRLQTGAQPQSSLGLPTSSVILKFEELLKQVHSSPSFLPIPSSPSSKAPATHHSTTPRWALCGSSRVTSSNAWPRLLAPVRACKHARTHATLSSSHALAPPVPLTKVVTHHLRSIMRTLKRIPELSAELQRACPALLLL